MANYLQQFNIETPVTILEEGFFEYTDVQNDASYVLFKTKSHSGTPKYLLAVIGYIRYEDINDYIVRDVLVTPRAWIIPVTKQNDFKAESLPFESVDDKKLGELAVWLEDSGDKVTLLEVTLNREEDTYFTI